MVVGYLPKHLQFFILEKKKKKKLEIQFFFKLYISLLVSSSYISAVATEMGVCPFLSWHLSSIFNLCKQRFNSRIDIRPFRLPRQIFSVKKDIAAFVCLIIWKQKNSNNIYLCPPKM